MKVYSKRVMFVIGDNQLIPHGGIGQCCKSFVEMCARLDWKCDIVTDRGPTDSPFIQGLLAAGASILWYPTPRSYKHHRRTFAFSEGPNFEAMANFRDGIMDAHGARLYDLIVANSLESIPAVSVLSLHEYIPVVLYTHNGTMLYRKTQGNVKTVFSEACNQHFNRLLEVNGPIVGTHTERNAHELLDNTGVMRVNVLPFTMPEQGLLAFATCERKGVLFVGRWEENKNPKLFLEVIKETGLPAKVLTNKTGAEAFRKAFAKEGITDYEIGEGLQGQEKVDFIRTSRVMFNPSLLESFSLATYEAYGHMPVIVLAKADWHRHFPKVLLTAEKTAGAFLAQVYEEFDIHKWYAQGALAWVMQQEYQAEQYWIDLVQNFKGKQSTSNQAMINDVVRDRLTITIDAFMSFIDRQPSVEDLQSLYANRHKYLTVNTDNDTYLTTDSAFLPRPRDTLEDLFA